MKKFHSPEQVTAPSFFSNFCSMPAEINWDDIYKMIALDTNLRYLTKKCRKADDSEYARIKKSAPAIAPACHFAANFRPRISVFMPRGTKYRRRKKN